MDSMHDTQKTFCDRQSDAIFNENKLMGTKYETLEIKEQPPWSSNKDL